MFRNKWVRIFFGTWLAYAIVHELIAPAQGGEFPKQIYTGEVPVEVQILREQAIGGQN